MPFLSDLIGQPFVLFATALAFLVALTVHEFSHALVATLLGDDTAKRLGRLTLNPAAHLDPWGTLMLIFVGFGWGKPVPYNPYNLRWPKWGPVAVGLAGPVSNLLLGTVMLIIALIVGPWLGPNNLFVIFLVTCVQINVVLMLFNLIPLPPLDGSNVLLALLAGPRYAAIRRFIVTTGPFILIGLVVLDTFGNFGFFEVLFNGPLQFVSNILSTRI